jgi:hypothetical protein
MRYVVFGAAWWRCLAAGVPFLAEPSDSFAVLDPDTYRGPDRGTDVIMNPHRVPQLARIFDERRDEVILYEAENLLVKGWWFAASQSIRRRARCEWWNYSAENSRVFGDTPKPLRIRDPIAPRDNAPRYVDVAFVGSLNARRDRILEDLRRAGLHVTHTTGVFGAELAEIERGAKIVLNVHHYVPGVFESFRVVPAVARGSLVVSEESEGAEGAEFATCTRYDRIVEAVLSKLSDKE